MEQSLLLLNIYLNYTMFRLKRIDIYTYDDVKKIFKLHYV